MSLHARIIVMTSAAVALAMIIGSVVVFSLIRSNLVGSLDDSLRARAQFAASARDSGHEHAMLPPVSHRQLPPPMGGTSSGYFQMITSKGTVSIPTNPSRLPAVAKLKQSLANASDDVRHTHFAISKQAVAVAEGNHKAVFETQTINHQRFRVLTVPLATGIAAQFARPTAEIDTSLKNIRRILMITDAGSVLLALFFGWLISRTSMRPVHRLTEATEDIAGSHDLTRRVKVNGNDDLARQATSFNLMMDALESATSAQQKLVDDASHELRTPLASIRTNIDILNKSAGVDADLRAELVASVSFQLDELATLVADLVDLAGTGKVLHERTIFLLDEVVADAVERAHHRWPDANFQLQIEASHVEGSQQRLHRAIANLLDNAVKWSPPGALIEVFSKAGEVVVRDHGPGVHEQDREAIFQRFYRADDARDTPGSGLGLSIVREIAVAHSGRVWVDHTDGGGAEFHLKLPLVAEHDDTTSLDDVSTPNVMS